MAIFDLLTKPGLTLSKKEEQGAKAVTQELLATLEQGEARSGLAQTLADQGGGAAGRPSQSAAAVHESPRTTKLYNRTRDVVTLDEVERIVV